MEIKDKRLVYDSKWLKVFEIDYVNGDYKGIWTYAARKDNVDGVDAVIVVPLLNGKIVTIKEFRVPIQNFEYGFPAGLIDGNESIEVCAARELKEETGLSIKRVLKVSPKLFSSAGLTTESTIMVFVEAEGEISTENLEASESIEVCVFGQDDISRLTADTFVSAKAWPIFTLYEKTGEIC